MSPRAVGVGLLLIGAAAACSGRRVREPTPAPAMPRSGPLSRSGAEDANGACERCHADAATTWRGSLHAQSWTDPIFQRSYQAEPSPFCRDCHAPETAAPAIGIACVTCHDPTGAGTVLAAPRQGDDAGSAARAPHAVIRDVAFAGDRACAGCHEFEFPNGRERGNDGARMQRTSSEHRASAHADRSCASCHMTKLANGTRGHGFAVASDPTVLRRALIAKASRHDERVALELAPGDVGHAVPTGDLFRRLVVVAEVIGVDNQLIAHVERPLARHFRFEEGVSGVKVQREIADDRVQGPLHIELEVGARASGREIAWRVEWQRVQAMHGDEAVIADAVVVAEGRLPAAAAAGSSH